MTMMASSAPPSAFAQVRPHIIIVIETGQPAIRGTNLFAVPIGPQTDLKDIFFFAGTESTEHLFEHLRTPSAQLPLFLPEVSSSWGCRDERLSTPAAHHLDVVIEDGTGIADSKFFCEDETMHQVPVPELFRRRERHEEVR